MIYSTNPQEPAPEVRELQTFMICLASRTRRPRPCRARRSFIPIYIFVSYKKEFFKPFQFFR